MENFDYSSMIYKIDWALFNQLYTSYGVPSDVKKRYKKLHEKLHALLTKKNNDENDEFKNLYQQYVQFEKEVQKLSLTERVITII